MSTTASPSPPTTPQPGAQSASDGALFELGEFMIFSGRAVVELRGALRYLSEVLRQAGILILGSTLVLVGVAAVAGGECGLFGDYFLRSLGAESYVGVFTTACGIREIVPQFFGYILAAKVGCGLVAEIGAMRINEEIDAMESVGVSAMRYVIATRLLATLITIPVIYVLALFAGDLGSYLVVHVDLGDVSRAAWASVHWGTQTWADNLESMLKVVVFTLGVVLVGCFYGHRARGGAVGVGAATARAMLVNLIFVNVVNAIFSALFFSHPRLPIGG